MSRYNTLKKIPAQSLFHMNKKRPVEKKRLVLLDAHAIIHRAYHALPDFASSKGEPTGALYGISTMLLKIVTDLKPDFIAACYDVPEPTYRHEAYQAYKAGRKKADDDLVAQLIRSKDIFKAFHVPMYEKIGFEADDILGTIVEKLRNDPVEIIVASGDMDTLQLVEQGRVSVYTLKKGINDTILYDEKAVKERFGFGPELLPDYKGLRGDPSDNIVGIPGIGEKTASTLIQNFGTIEEMYRSLEKKPHLFTEVGIKERIVDLLTKHKEEAEFSKMLATIRRDAPIEFSLPAKKWREEVDISAIEAFFGELEFRSLVQRARNVLLGEGGAEKASVPKEENEAVDPDELAETALALWVADSSIANPSLEEVLLFAKTKSFPKAKEVIFSELKKRNLEKVFFDIEKPLLPIVRKMGERGIAIDLSYLKALSAEYHESLASIERDIHGLAGEVFNINSPRQLSVILFEKLNLSLKNHKKTEGGVKSTRESELEKMKELHPIVERILAHRELQKLLSTYIDTIPTLVGEDGRLHARFLQAGAATGRMASENPNVQNIPIKSELGRRIRRAFIAAPGHLLAAFDYSQIELRVAAFLSKDPKLIEIFREGGDIHTAVAAQVFKVPREKVDKEMRRRAKIINFGILYGMGVNALKGNLGTTRAEAQQFYNEYFETFSVLASYLDKVKAEAERRGYTETYFGRRRYFSGIKSPIPYIKASSERMAINAPIQGTQADIIKIAMAKIDSELSKRGLKEKVHLILQVHDELVYEIENENLSEAAPFIQSIMEGVLPPESIEGIPLTVGFSSGRDWGSLT